MVTFAFIYWVSQAVQKAASAKTRFLQYAAFIPGFIRKFTLERAMEGYTSTLSLPRHYMRMEGQRHAPAALSPWKKPGTHCTGDWVGLRAVLDGRGKSGPHRDSIADLLACNTQTDWAIGANIVNFVSDTI